MGDIWLPGLPPAYTDYAHCLTLLLNLGMPHNDAVILAAIGGAEGGYDYRVINDTPATGDYSVGIWQINYYDGLYASRAAAFGTPRELIEYGPGGQAAAANQLYRQSGFSPWQADITNNRWQQFVGSGPVPQNPGPGGGPGNPVINLHLGGPEYQHASHEIARMEEQTARLISRIRSIAGPGSQP